MWQIGHPKPCKMEQTWDFSETILLYDHKMGIEIFHVRTFA